MKTLKYTLYIAMMLFVTATAHAAPAPVESTLSLAMFIYIPSALLAFLITYFVWRMNALKRRQNPPKVTNRGPVRRPIVAYQRRKIAETR